MSEYNASTLIPIMQPAFAETQENTGIMLLTPLAEQVGVDVSGKMITNLVKRKADVHAAITGVIANPEMRNKAEQTIIDDVLPKINIYLRDEACVKLLKALHADASVPSKTYKEYEQYYQDEDYSRFFVGAILYGFSRPNKLTSEEEMQEDDIHYINEAGYRCPMTGDRLYKRVKGRMVKKYRVIQIYPEDLAEEKKADFNKIKAPPSDFDDEDNKIVVSPDYAESYIMDPTVKEYAALLKRKTELKKKHQAIQTTDENPLEEEISEVVKAIADIDNMTELTPFTDALTLEDKIEEQNRVLLNAIHADVVQYYPFIAKQFSLREGDNGSSYKIIRSEVTTCYEKLEQAQLTQEEICEAVSAWIMQSIGLGEKYKIATRIVVSFFVQNCAIFTSLKDKRPLLLEEN